MAHTRTAKKAIRQNVRRRARNRTALSTMRTQVKKIEKALAEGNLETAEAEFVAAQKLVDKAAKANRIHANKAARMKSRLARAINGAKS